MKWPVLALVAALAAAVAGCPADDDDGPAPDAAIGAGGLVIAWQARPTAIPGPVDNRLTLTAVTLRLRDARAIGDAGAGDDRTLAPRVELRWTGGATPAALRFPAAPAGLYARMSFALDRDGDALAYELTGTVELEGVVEPFAVRDSASVPVSFSYQAALAPGGETVVPVRVDLDAVVRALDFGRAPVVSGQRVIEGTDPQMSVLRTEMAKAFGVHSL